MKVRTQFPEKAKALFIPAPYKVFHGGRGSAKSWSFCKALLTLGCNRPLTILCTREIQNSIDESVHKLLKNQIAAMELEGFYQVLDTEIRGANGTQFIFAGIKNQFRKIKSYEAIDICAVFEATFISKPAWDALLPTIRLDPPKGPFGQGSEVWVEFNPELATDETYKRFVLNPPEGSVVVDLNYVDNPWFPDILRRQMEAAKTKDYDDYLTTWMGKTRKVLAGAIYAKELTKAIEEGRISPQVVYDRSKPVDVIFDLGRSDTCSLWFVQQIGMWHSVIDYYGNTGFDFTHYLEEIEGKKYRIRNVILPHDAEHKVISAKHSVKAQAQAAYPGDGRVRIVPACNPMIRVNALRSLFGRMQFNEEKTAEGVLGLQHYQYGVSESGQRTQQPLHNWASHPADSLGHYALSLNDEFMDVGPPEELDPWSNSHDSSATSWMA